MMFLSGLESRSGPFPTIPGSFPIHIIFPNFISFAPWGEPSLNRSSPAVNDCVWAYHSQVREHYESHSAVGSEENAEN